MWGVDSGGRCGWAVDRGEGLNVAEKSEGHPSMEKGCEKLWKVGWK